MSFTACKDIEELPHSTELVSDRPWEVQTVGLKRWTPKETSLVREADQNPAFGRYLIADCVG